MEHLLPNSNKEGSNRKKRGPKYEQQTAVTGEADGYPKQDLAPTRSLSGITGGLE